MVIFFGMLFAKRIDMIFFSSRTPLGLCFRWMVMGSMLFGKSTTVFSADNKLSQDIHRNVLSGTYEIAVSRHEHTHTRARNLLERTPARYSSKADLVMNRVKRWGEGYVDAQAVTRAVVGLAGNPIGLEQWIATYLEVQSPYNVSSTALLNVGKRLYMRALASSEDPRVSSSINLDKTWDLFGVRSFDGLKEEEREIFFDAVEDALGVEMPAAYYLSPEGVRIEIGLFSRVPHSEEESIIIPLSTHLLDGTKRNSTYHTGHNALDSSDPLHYAGFQAEAYFDDLSRRIPLANQILTSVENSHINWPRAVFPNKAISFFELTVPIHHVREGASIPLGEMVVFSDRDGTDFFAVPFQHTKVEPKTFEIKLDYNSVSQRLLQQFFLGELVDGSRVSVSANSGKAGWVSAMAREAFDNNWDIVADL